jgi:hypothetical protein
VHPPFGIIAVGAAVAVGAVVAFVVAVEVDFAVAVGVVAVLVLVVAVAVVCRMADRTHSRSECISAHVVFYNYNGHIFRLPDKSFLLMIAQGHFVVL